MMENFYGYFMLMERNYQEAGFATENLDKVTELTFYLIVPKKISNKLIKTAYAYLHPYKVNI